MGIKPLGDRIVVEPMSTETKTKGGLIIPIVARETPNKGTVVAVAPGTKDEKMIVKDGDVVLYPKYIDTGINYKGKYYLIMRQSDLLTII
jgi:chaperonin GroES